MENGSANILLFWCLLNVLWCTLCIHSKITLPFDDKNVEHTKGHCLYTHACWKATYLDIYLCVMFHLSYIFSNLQIRYRCLASRMCMSKGHLRRIQTLGHIAGWPNYTICSCGDNSVFTFLRMWIAFRFARVSSNQDKLVCVPKFWDCRNWQEVVFCVVHSILVACTFSLHCFINNLCKLLGVDLV